ncbi:hypothetical protein VYA_28400 [Vibrio alfacsensis]|nr:hypothetical protein VYA_28400 [Vibrio alfacsensis]
MLRGKARNRLNPYNVSRKPIKMIVFEAVTVSQSDALSLRLNRKGPPPINNSEIAKHDSPGILR